MNRIYGVCITLFVILSSSIAAEAQNYGCSFLDTIIATMAQKGREYNIYSSIMTDRIKAAKAESNAKVRIGISDHIRDSLSKCCQYESFFDDSLFHLKDKILLVDTFNFFSNYCAGSKKIGVTIINNIVDWPCSTTSQSIIELKSIKVYKNNFIITMKHPNSDLAVQFLFELIANFPPRLEKVEQGFVE